MDQRRLPGAFILEAAEAGLAATFAVTCYSGDSKCERLAANLSLSATLLNETGKEINQNANYFKDNFQQLFEEVLRQCKKQYETVLTAVHKAKSWTNENPEEVAESPPKERYEMLIWVLNKNETNPWDPEEAASCVMEKVLLLQFIVQAVVLQILAQKRELTPAEHHSLRSLKSCFGEVITGIRHWDIASVLAFGLADSVNAANAVQVIEAAEAAENASREPFSPDDTSSITASVTTRSLSEFSIALPQKEQITSTIEPLVTIVRPEPKDDIVYEMYRAVVSTDVFSSTQNVFRLFGIPFRNDRSRIEVMSLLDRVPATEDDIKAFIQKERAKSNSKQPTTLEALINISSRISTSIYALVIRKNDETSFPRREWSVECLFPYKQRGAQPSRRFWKKETGADGYIMILKGKPSNEPLYHSRPPPPPPPASKWPPPPPNWPSGPPRPPGPPPPPAGGISLPPPRPPPNWPSGTPQPPGPPPPPARGTSAPIPPPPSNWPLGRSPPVRRGSIGSTRRDRTIFPKKRMDSGVEIKLTQQEIETVVNDFLATFSTLYDGITVEERGAALKAIKLTEEDDWADNSECASIASSSSIVDD